MAAVRTSRDCTNGSMQKMDRKESGFPYRHFELFGFPIYLCYNLAIVSKEAVMMKKKSILAIGLTAVLLFGPTGEAEAFGWGDIAGKAADKAIGSVLGSSAKKKPVKQSRPKSEKQKKSEREAEKYGVKRIESPDGTNPTAFAGTLDPWPPDELSARPDWFDNRTQPWIMTNARLVAEYESMIQWRAYATQNGLGTIEPDEIRYTELMDEIHVRVRAIERYCDAAEYGDYQSMQSRASMGDYQRAVASNINPLRDYDLELSVPANTLPGYHPKRN